MKTRRETMLTSKQAQHNYARFYTGGVRLFVLPDKPYKFFSHRIYRLVNQKSRR